MLIDGGEVVSLSSFISEVKFNPMATMLLVGLGKLKKKILSPNRKSKPRPSDL
jgi:hypothetical protein